MEAQKEKQLVVLDNVLVQLSRHNLNLNEHKAFAFIVSRIPDLNDVNGEAVVTFKKADFCRALNIKVGVGNNTHLKATIRSLARKTVELDIEDEWIIYSILQEAKIKEHGEDISVQFNPKMKPFIYGLKEKFTEYQLLYLLGLESKYALRLYEWLKSFHLSEVVGYIGKLKSLFNVKYKRTIDLIKFTVEPAIAEINEKTDILVTFDRKKDGRVITALKFNVKKKEDLSCLEDSAISEPEEQDNTIYVLTHIKPDGTPEMVEIKGSAEAQRLIDDRGFENGKTFISKKVGDSVVNATPDFDLK